MLIQDKFSLPDKTTFQILKLNYNNYIKIYVLPTSSIPTLPPHHMFTHA